MTDRELLDLLSGVKSRYIQEAQDFRSGKSRAYRPAGRGQTLRILSAAAMLVLVVCAGMWMVMKFPREKGMEATRAEIQTARAEIQTATEAISGETAESQADGDAADTSVLRSETTQLHYFPEGVEQVCSATLFTGEAYSIYIPDGMWEYRSTTYGGTPADRWIYTANEEIMLTAICWGSADGEPPYEAMYQANTGFRLTLDENGDLVTDYSQVGPETPMKRAHFICVGDNLYYVLLLEYPVEAAEGAGAMLSAMAATFEKTPSGAGNVVFSWQGNRPEEMDRAFYTGSSKDLVNFRLFSLNDEDSLYIPAEGWTAEAVTMYGVSGMRWYCQNDPQLWLFLGELQGDGEINIRENTWQGNALEPMADGTYLSAENQQIRIAFPQLGGRQYLLATETPVEEQEQIGSLCLDLMAESFWPNEEIQVDLGSGEPTALDFDWFYGRYYRIPAPAAGWSYRNLSYGTYNADRWDSTENPACFYMVVPLGNMTYDEGIAWAMQQQADTYDLYAGLDGSSVLGTDGSGGNLVTRLVERNDILYAFVEGYPDSETDGLRRVCDVLLEYLYG